MTTIYGKEGTYAQEYAITNSIKFKAINSNYDFAMDISEIILEPTGIIHINIVIDNIKLQSLSPILSLGLYENDMLANMIID